MKLRREKLKARARPIRQRLQVLRANGRRCNLPLSLSGTGFSKRKVLIVPKLVSYLGEVPCQGICGDDINEAVLTEQLIGQNKRLISTECMCER